MARSKNSRPAVHRLADILSQLKARYPGFSSRLKEAEAVNRWEAAVGPAIAKHARALRVQDGVLWVEVEHPIWRSELHHRKRQILDLLNGKALPSDSPNLAIKDLLFLEPREARAQWKKG